MDKEAKGIELKTCLRCEYEWWPKKPGRPMQCARPSCRSAYWDVPRRVKK